MLLAGCLNSAGDQRSIPATKNEQSPVKSDRQVATRPYDFSRELTSDEARRLIPEAASLSREEFQRILKDTPVELGEINNQSLTALLLAIDPLIAEQQNPKSRRAFHYVGSPRITPDPEDLRAAVEGQESAAYVSIIQPEYITNCTCLTKGDRAEGRVAFRAANLYIGEANFAAERTRGEWQIVGFQVPEYLLTTKRRPDGSWELASEEMLLGISWP